MPIYTSTVEKRIVNESCKTMRALARQVLKTRWFESFLVLLIAYIITNVPVLIITAAYSSSVMSMLCNVY